MSMKCVYCHQKKGKRLCPALGGNICSQCCGEFRVTVIHCPEDCTYLSNHENYQRGKIGQVFSQERLRLAGTLQDKFGKQGLTILNLLDMTAYAYFHHRRAAQDNEVLLGLEFVRRSLSPLQIPGASMSHFGEFVKEEVDVFLKDAPSAKETVAEVVEANLSFLKGFSDDPILSTRYLKGLIGFMESFFPDTALHLKEIHLKPEKRIITLEDEAELHKGREGKTKSGF